MKTAMHAFISLLLVAAPLVVNAGMYSISINYKLSETREDADCFTLEHDIHMRVTVPALKFAGYDVESEESWEQLVADESRRERATKRRAKLAMMTQRQGQNWNHGTLTTTAVSIPSEEGGGRRERFLAVMEEGLPQRRLGCDSLCKKMCRATGNKRNKKYYYKRMETFHKELEDTFTR